MTTPGEPPAEAPDRPTGQPGSDPDPLYGVPEEPDPHYGQPGDEPGAASSS